MNARFLSLILALITMWLSSGVSSQAAEPVRWEGTVTAVNSNGNRPGRSFTARDIDGRVKMFYIASLTHLETGDRVILHYLPKETFPLEVTRIKFLPPLLP